MRESDLRIIIIAAKSQNNVIGKGIRIPWHSTKEINHFKKTTIGFPIIMGRITWESLKLPLNERTNIVVTRQMNYSAEADIIITHSLKESLTYCEQKTFEKCFIIGGGKIFDSAIKLADEMIISEMKFNSDGDVFFPKIDQQIWAEVNQEDFEEFTIHTYIRKEKMNEIAVDTKN